MKKIGVTTYIDINNKRTKNMIGVDYIRAIEKAGAIPIIIPLTDKKSSLDRFIELIDGLILTGGDDINPNHYNEKNEGLSKKVSLSRDDMEMYLMKESIKRDLPILGICRGMQLINVFYGGSLYQDIMTQYDTIIDHENIEDTGYELHHQVDFENDSLLSKVYKQKKMLVNSKHHQAIKTLGDGLEIIATSADGIPEAVYHHDNKVLGVQWHPENLFDIYDNHNKLFRYYIEEMVQVTHCTISTITK